VFLLLVFVGGCWVAVNANQARKYRALVRLAKETPSNAEPAKKGWTVNYLERGKRKMLNIAEGKDEQAVIKQAVKQGVGYDKIMSVVKC